MENVIESTLALLAASCKALVEVDLERVAELNHMVGFPVALYEARRDMMEYLAGSAPGLSIEDVLAQITSPDVKEVYGAIVSGVAVSEVAYRDAIAIHRPGMQAVFSDYFADNNLDALVIPTVPLTAPPIGHDDTVELNGRQLPTMPTIIRNTDPSSNVGIPSLSVAAGLAANGLPVDVCLEGPAGSDRKILAIGKALQDEIGFLPRPESK